MFVYVNAKQEVYIKVKKSFLKLKQSCIALA